MRVVDNVWIPLSDGCRLAGRVWLPEGVEELSAPAILEYIPYRKSDDTAAADSMRHGYFAERGYASIRVDLRGSGDSEGLMEDEYTLREQEDALEVLSWIADQRWCDGNVGMLGISWGGFNSLQVAARRPPELKAVISVCASDDRYADDVHYRGGCLLAIDLLPWATAMLAFNARPPDPAIVGPRWRENWLGRLEGATPFIARWLAHQRRDEYWRHGSVCEDYAAIECPVYAVGGWADGYRNAVLRLLAGLSCPRKGLIGPWSHNYPDEGVPGPAIGFLEECVRWWDCWLKGGDRSIMDEPMLRAWMPEAVEPQPYYDERPGRWVAEERWPSPRIEARRISLGERESLVHVLSPQQTGLAGGTWCPWGDPRNPTELPLDQRTDDALSLAFTTEPLREGMEILGFPEVELALTVDQPCALVAVRLCDVAPTGASTLVTRGLLNLAHRDGHAEPQALVPGRRYLVVVRLDAIAYAFPASHSIRVAVSPTYWPLAWPSPTPVTLGVDGAASELRLPARPPHAGDGELRPFASPAQGHPLADAGGKGTANARTIRHDVGAGIHELVFSLDYGGRHRLPVGGIEFAKASVDTYTIAGDKPLSARVRTTWSAEVGRAAWQTRVEAEAEMWSDAETFYVATTLGAWEGPDRVFARSWTLDFPRDHI